MNEPDKASEYVVASIKGSNPTEDPVAYAKRVSLLGSIHSLKGEYPRSTELYREAIALLTKRDPREEARVRRFLAETLKFMGDFRGSVAEAEESARLANVTQYGTVESISHSIAGEAYAMLGEPDKAKGHLESSEKFVRETGDRISEIIFRISRGANYTVTQEYKKAILDLETGIELAKRTGIAVYEAEGLFRLGVAHHYSHHELKKRDNIREAYNIYKRLGNRERAMLCKAWLES
jgi:tetratricopeptide (TPR) repeat protein